MRKETLKARLPIGTVLTNLGFRKGRKDGVYFCACHPSDKPTVIAKHEEARANCLVPECKIKNADVFDVIRVLNECDFRKAMKIAEKMLNDLGEQPNLLTSLIEGHTKQKEDSTRHEIIPQLKPLLASHHKWLEGLLGVAKDWTVECHQISSLKKTHIAVPIRKDQLSYAFIPIRARQDSTFYKGQNRTLQWFPQLQDHGRKLIICPGEMETLCIEAEVMRRGLSHEYSVICATNNFRPLDKLVDLVKTLPLNRYEEIVIINYHSEESKLTRQELVKTIKEVIVDPERIHFWALPIQIVDFDSLFMYLQKHKDSLPYPLHIDPIDKEDKPKKLKGKAAVYDRLAEASKMIYMSETEEIDYLHSVLCQVVMPRSATKERFYEHRNGGMLLRIEAGSLYNGKDFIEQPLPYGPIPRMILIYISTMAILNRNPVVDVGASLSSFMKSIGYSVIGGKNGTINQFKEQLNSLVASRFILGMKLNDGVITVETKPFSRFLAWLDDSNGQLPLWPGSIRLSDEFYKSLTQHAVPIDPRALVALRHSALGIDIYTWMTSRLCRIPENSDLFLNWKLILEQFSDGSLVSRSFRRNFVKAMNQAHAVYPTARVEEVSDARGYHIGYRFKRSAPPISSQNKKLIT